MKLAATFLAVTSTLPFPVVAQQLTEPETDHREVECQGTVKIIHVQFGDQPRGNSLSYRDSLVSGSLRPGRPQAVDRYVFSDDRCWGGFDRDSGPPRPSGGGGPDHEQRQDDIRAADGFSAMEHIRPDRRAL
jgi:hypothetical protein